MAASTQTSLRRRASSAAVSVFCALALLLALIPLAWILFFVVRRGLPALDLAFFTHTPPCTKNRFAGGEQCWQCSSASP